jgi:hypothetical protein
VAVDEPVAVVRKSMQCGARYFVRLIGTALDEDIAIQVAVPNMHGYRDVPEAKSPRSQLECQVLYCGAAGGRCQRPREFISHGATDLRALDDRGVASGERAAHPCQRLVRHALPLSQPGLEGKARQSWREAGEALRHSIRAQHPVLRDLGFWWRGTAHYCAADEAIAEKPRASGGVRSAAGVPEHRKAIDVEVIGQPADIACPRLVGTTRVVRAVPVSRPIGSNEPHTFARGRLRPRREEVASPRRTVKRHYRPSVRGPVLNPRQLTTICEFKQSGVAHSA